MRAILRLLKGKNKTRAETISKEVKKAINQNIENELDKMEEETVNEAMELIESGEVLSNEVYELKEFVERMIEKTKNEMGFEEVIKLEIIEDEDSFGLC